MAEAEPTLLRMAISGGFCSETCPDCGGLNTFPGFDSMLAYICRECGKSSRLSGRCIQD
jgi:hypothetical protein